MRRSSEDSPVIAGSVSVRTILLFKTDTEAQVLRELSEGIPETNGASPQGQRVPRHLDPNPTIFYGKYQVSASTPKELGITYEIS